MRHNFFLLPLAVRLTAIVYLVAVSVSMVAEDLRPVFLATGVSSLAALAGGFLFFPRLRSFIVFDVPLLSAQTQSAVPLVLCGVEVNAEHHPQDLVCIVRIHGLSQLVAVAAVSIATIIVLTSPKASYEAYTHGGFAFWRVYFAILIGWVVLSRSVHWLSECHMLRRSRAAIGAVHFLSGTTGAMLDYQFPDPQGERRAGRIPVNAPDQDNGVIVFYSPSEPDKNLPHRALVFHSLSVQVVPGS